MPVKPESGLSDHRPEFVREDVAANGDPLTPDNPDFLRFSDNIRSFEWEGSPELESQRGLGDVDPKQHFKGPEEHTITVTYDLQRWISAATPDASRDGLLRDSEGFLPDTHTVVDREAKSSLAPVSTVNGTNAKDTRIYTVGVGGAIDEAVLTGDPGSQQPVVVELTYEFEVVRSYQVDQPDAATTLDVVSSDAGDTTQTLTIESEGATVNEDIALNGDTVVTGVESFEDIDALSLDGETDGDVTVTETGGDDLAVLRGSTFYDGIEGDTGIPALGTGSHEAALGTAYEQFLGDTITRDGAAVALDVNSFEISVSNNTDRFTREDSTIQRVLPGIRDIEISTSLFGENVTHENITESFGNTAADVVWTMDGGSVTVQDARVSEPGGRTYEGEELAFVPDVSMVGEGISVA